jgi:hypothetical protein
LRTRHEIPRNSRGLRSRPRKKERMNEKVLLVSDGETQCRGADRWRDPYRTREDKGYVELGSAGPRKGLMRSRQHALLVTIESL